MVSLYLIASVAGATLAVDLPRTLPTSTMASRPTDTARANNPVNQTQLEEEVLAQINFARTQPRAYAEMLRSYRRRYRGRYTYFPERNEIVETEEGIGAVDEAIRFLAKQPALPPLRPSNLLALACFDHVDDQGPKGMIGHESTDDNAEPWDRVMRRGGGDYVEEIIAYGPTEAAEIVRAWVINDGSLSRGHRKAVFDDEMHFAGVGCGNHRTYDTMCVVVMARTPKGDY